MTTPVLQPVGSKTVTDLQRRVSNTVNAALQGKLNNTGSVSLDVSPATATIVSDPLVTSMSKIFLSPRDAAAAAENWYISAVADGSFTITHAASASARNFDYAVFG